MSLFDSNTWYNVVSKSNTSFSFHASNLTDGTAAAYFLITPKTIESDQLWQFYQYNNSYVMRSKGSGAGSYLIAGTANESAPIVIAGNTVPSMANTSFVDNSMFWQVTPWNDGWFYFTNSANSTGWNLQVRPTRPESNLLAMSSNITKASQPFQSYKWTPNGKINDAAFSTIDTPTGIATNSVSAASNTSSATASTSPTPSAGASHSGLSNGAAAAIGASIAGVAVIILAVVGFIFFRRMKRNSAEYAAMLKSPNDIHKEQVENGYHGAPEGGYYKAELASNQVQTASVSREPSVGRSELGNEVRIPMTDLRHSHQELPAEDRTDFQAVELSAAPRTP